MISPRKHADLRYEDRRLAGRRDLRAAIIKLAAA